MGTRGNNFSFNLRDADGRLGSEELFPIKKLERERDRIVCVELWYLNILISLGQQYRFLRETASTLIVKPEEGHIIAEIT